MTKQAAFFLIILVILVVLIAYVFACERAAGEREGAATEKTGGAQYTHQLLPAGKGPHTHLAALSDIGDGTSTTDMGHSHRVRGFDVRPGPDGHVHDITQYIVPTAFTA